MGVPTLFRWLRDRYPRMMQIVEKMQQIDNFYIDMNGMIHPCFHPMDREQPQSESEVFQEIFIYIDKLIDIVKPQKLLYMAIDGTAPLAKLNQQRARRFAAAYESQYNKFLKEKQNNGKENQNTKQAVLDSNQITPGTPFMQRLTEAIKIYIASRQSTTLKNIRIIFSDSITPGEGEHKIMHFIRSQRQQPNYNPNTSHCIHGLDGDLIMLALASHEPNFYILREQVIFDRNIVVCQKCGQMITKDSPHVITCPNVPNPDDTYPIVDGKNFHFMSVKLFREYLLRDFQCRDEDFERVLDDFVFLCFMSGNDFLPHIHAMKITDNAILRIIDVYQRIILPKRRFITDSGNVDFYALLEYLSEFSKIENKILYASQETNDRIADSIKYKKIQNLHAQQEQTTDEAKINEIQKQIDQYEYYSLMEAQIIDKNEYYNNIQITDAKTLAVFYEYRKFSFKMENWRQEYYMGASKDEIDKMCYQFLRGMQWVCNYYCYQLIDWDFYYPYDEPPLLQDLCTYLRNHMNECQNILKTFDRQSKPFSPLEQLLAVLPPYSCQALPEVFQPLMLEENSPLKPFYPNKFKIDVTGKTQLYQGVVHLPFINKQLLKSEFQKIFQTLPESIKQQNQFKNEELFVNQSYLVDSKIIQAVNEKSEIPGVKTRENGSVKYYLIRPNTELSRYLQGSPLPGQYIQTSMPFMQLNQYFDITFENLGKQNSGLNGQTHIQPIYDVNKFPKHLRWNNYVNESVHANYCDFNLNKDFKNYTQLLRQPYNASADFIITDTEWQRDEMKRNNMKYRIYKDIYTNEEINAIIQKTHAQLVQYNPRIGYQQQRMPQTHNQYQNNQYGYRQQNQYMQPRNQEYRY